MTTWVRAAIVRIVDHGESTTVLGPRGALRFDGDSAALLRAVLEIHARPTMRDALFAELARRSGYEASVDPANPSGVAKPVDAANPSGLPAKPVDAANPSGVPKPVDAANPSGVPKPVDAANPSGVAKPVDAANPSGLPAKPVDDLIAMLVREGVLIEASASQSEQPAAGRRPFGRRIVLAISGAVAAVDAPMLVRGLHALGCDVRVALTKSAKRFVAVPGLDALTHHQVWRGLWQRDERVPVPHINLAEWAELVIVWPASATTIARIASGDCSDLVSAIATATRAPVVIAPSMNDAMLAAPAVQDNLERLRTHGRWIVHGTLGVEVAHRPEDRRPMFGPAAPPSVMLDIARHLLVDVVPRPRLPVGAPAWERLWATTPSDQLPWNADPVDAPLAAALDRLAPGNCDVPANRTTAASPPPAPSNDHEAATETVRRATLLDLGTGAGIVAIEAARIGFRVTATDVSPTALGRARDAAGGVPILFALDDVTASHLDGSFDVVVDRGLLHCLPREQRPAYASCVTARTAPGSCLLVVAHGTGELATNPVDDSDLRELLPAFELVSATPTTLSRGPAQLFELRRS